MRAFIDRIAAALLLATVFVALLCCAAGCARKPKHISALPDLGQRLQAISATTTIVSAELPKIADRIDQQAKSVDKKTSGKVDVSPELIGLATETAGIRGAANRLAEVPEQAKQAQGEATQYVTTIDKLEARNDKLEEEKKNGLRAKGLSQIGFGGFALFIGIVGYFSGTKIGKTLGIAVGLGGAALVTLGLVVGYYSAWIIIPVIAIAVGALGYLAWRFVVERRATKELMKGGEIIKQVLPTPMRQQIFGNGAMPGILDAIQSETTKAEVREARKDPTVRLAPDIATTNVSEPGTVPGPAVAVPTADVAPSPPAVIAVPIQPDDATRG